jgi:hypothetical protein
VLESPITEAVAEENADLVRCQCAEEVFLADGTQFARVVFLGRALRMMRAPLFELAAIDLLLLFDSLVIV